MRIRLIDVDGHNFPNLPLMKISAYHKSLGDEVEWYDPLLDWITIPDIVYMSKVFSYTPDYEHPINGKKIIKGGTGYYFPSGGEPLPKEIEDSFPDYSIYPQFADTAYGFLTRGCPRGCDFCIVAEKEGKKSILHYDVLETKQNRALVHITLETGRSHQIRVQFSSRNLPLVYDQRYNPHTKKGQIALYAYQLTFIHPTQKEPMTISCLPPKKDPWNLFEVEQCLKNTEEKDTSEKVCL